jgi:hypothetical protein
MQCWLYGPRWCKFLLAASASGSQADGHQQYSSRVDEIPHSFPNVCQPETVLDVIYIDLG